MDGSHLRALQQPGHVRLRVEETDVVAERTGEQHVVLQYRADQFAQAVQAQLRKVQAGHADLSLHWREDAQQDVEQGALAAARGADDGHRLAAGDAQVEAVEDPGLLFRVAVAQALDLDARLALAEVLREDVAVADLRGLEHDVGQALALQLEHAQLEELVDQAADAAVELRLVGVEGHQDADAELAVHHHGRAEPDHQQVLHAEQQAVELLVEQLQLLRTQAGVDLFHQQAEPYRAALVLALEQLQRADAAHRLEEVALLACGVDDLLLGGVAQRPVPDPAAEGVEAHGGDGDGRQRRTVEQHHAEGGDGHQAVQHRREEGRGEGLLDAVHRAEARHHVAQVALLEILRGQPQQVAEDVGLPLHAEQGAHVHHHPGAHPADRLLHQQQQAEADGQGAEQVTVFADDDVVDGPLQEERTDQREHFQRAGEQQHLGQRAVQPGDLAEHAQQLDPRRRLLFLEAALRPEFQGYPGEAPRDFLQAQPALAVGGVVEHRAAPVDRLEHDEVVEVPVQHAGQLELAEVAEVELHRAGAQAEAVGGLDQLLEGDALERYGEAPAQFHQAGVVAVVAGDHRQAGQAAFGGFGLQHQRQAAAQAQGESVEKGHGSFLEFAGQAVERFQNPFVEAPGVLEDVGVQ